MGKYFGKEPHYSQEEAEAQAREAIEAATKRGRPPAEDWRALGSRMGDINRDLVARPSVEIPPPPPRRNADRPRDVSQILRPRPAPAPEPAEPQPPAPAKRATKAPSPARAPAPAKRATKASAPVPSPAKRATKASAPAPTTRKRSVPVAEPQVPAAPKRPATKKRSG
ncbi:MAG: hypothetical protein ACR2KK_21695 [Acidimicrobiales bacterium]